MVRGKFPQIPLRAKYDIILKDYSLKKHHPAGNDGVYNLAGCRFGAAGALEWLKTVFTSTIAL